MYTETNKNNDLRQSIDNELEKHRQKGESYAVIAMQTKVSEKTLRALRDGKKVRYITLLNIARNLGIEVENVAPIQADITFGGYSKELVAAYIDPYYMYRRAFGNKSEIVRSLLSLEWSEEQHCLTYIEYHDKDDHIDKTLDTSIDGIVHVPPNMSLMHFPATMNGLVRLITVKRPPIPSEGMCLCGMMLSQADPARKGLFQPAMACVVLCKIDLAEDSDQVSRVFNEKTPGYEKVAKLLNNPPVDFGHIST